LSFPEEHGNTAVYGELAPRCWSWVSLAFSHQWLRLGWGDGKLVLDQWGNFTPEHSVQTQSFRDYIIKQLYNKTSTYYFHVKYPSPGENNQDSISSSTFSTCIIHPWFYNNDQYAYVVNLESVRGSGIRGSEMPAQERESVSFSSFNHCVLNTYIHTAEMGS
jgi:hypothetical protein